MDLLVLTRTHSPNLIYVQRTEYWRGRTGISLYSGALLYLLLIHNHDPIHNSSPKYLCKQPQFETVIYQNLHGPLAYGLGERFKNLTS